MQSFRAQALAIVSICLQIFGAQALATARYARTALARKALATARYARTALARKALATNTAFGAKSHSYHQRYARTAYWHDKAIATVNDTPTQLPGTTKP